MRALLLPFFICLIANITQAQPTIEWSISLGGTRSDVVRYVIQTADGGYMVAGTANSSDGDVVGSHGNDDIWLVKLDAQGNKTWQRTYGGANYEFLRGLAATADGGYVLGGNSDSNDGDVTGNHGDYDIWIVKVNADGDIIWQKSFGGSGYDAAMMLQPVADGGYFITGYTQSNDGDVTGLHGAPQVDDVWVLKLNGEGELEWQKTYGGTSTDDAYCGFPTPDGGYIFAGLTYSNNLDVPFNNHGYSDTWVVKLNATGAIQWQKLLGGSSYDEFFCIRPTADGGYIATGFSQSTDGDFPTAHCSTANYECKDLVVLKLNSSGGIEWTKSLGGSKNEIGRWVTQTADGGYVVVAEENSVSPEIVGNHGSTDVWVIKLSSTGSVIWQKVLGGSSSDLARFVTQTTDGGYLVAANSSSTGGQVVGNHGSDDIWIVKLSSASATSEAEAVQPIDIYPNPVQDRLYFKTDCTGAMARVTDQLGRNCLSQSVPSNNALDVSGLPAGWYAISLQTEEGTFYAQKFCKQ